jgi:hypothetical protein
MGWAIFFTNSSGADFSHIFSTENHFPPKIPWNFLEKLFLRKIPFFPTFWGVGKIFRGIFPEIFPRKNV